MNLKIDGVSCIRGSRQLFANLSANVAPGEFLRVRGANGAGKTSLLRMLCGLMQPTHGQVLWQGVPIADQRSEYGRNLVYVGHAAALKDELSPVENLLDACVLSGHSTPLQVAMAALENAGLRGFERTPARYLSQGQRRRSALARLNLSQQAPLWILDEPFNTLDAAATAWLAGLIEKHLQQAGLVVLTSHQDMNIKISRQKELVL